MASGLAQGFHHKVRGAVDDLRLLGIAVGRIDKTGKLYHFDQAIQITATGCFYLRKKADRAKLCRLGTFLCGH